MPSEGDSKISLCVGPCRDWQGPHSTSFKYIPHRKVSETCDLGQSDLDLNFCVFFKKGIGPFEVSGSFKENIENIRAVKQINADFIHISAAGAVV